MKRVTKNRRRKTECDWDNWKRPINFEACVIKDDCNGCGAYKKEMVNQK